MAETVSFLGDLRNKWKQYGVLRLGVRIWKALLRRMGIRIEKFLVMKKELSGPETPNPPKIDIEVQELTEAHIEHLRGMGFGPDKINVFRKRLADPEYVGIGAFHNDKLVYSCWLSLEKFESSVDLGDSVDLQPEEGILIDAYTHPDYRGMGLHTYMNTVRQNRLYELDKKTVVGLLQYENIPARKSQMKVGLKPDSIIYYRNIFGKKIVTEKSLKGRELA